MKKKEKTEPKNSTPAEAQGISAFFLLLFSVFLQ
jgi:hypothetical protein